MKNTLNLEERAVSSISTAEDINDVVHVIADNRVGICSFNVNKSNVADTLLPHGAAEVSFQSAQRMISLLNTMWQVSLQGYAPPLKTLEIYRIDHFRALSLVFLKLSCSLIRARDENSRAFSARLPESRRRCFKT